MSQIDYNHYRNMRQSNQDFDIKIECQGTIFNGHKKLISKKSEYINGLLIFHENNPPLSAELSLRLDEISPGILSKILDLMYEEDYEFIESEIPQAFVASDFLLCHEISHKIFEKIKIKLESKEYSNETLIKLFGIQKDLSKDDLKSILIKCISNYPMEYLETYKILSVDQIREIIQYKSLLFRDENNNFILFDKYRKKYLEFIGKIFTDPSIIKETQKFSNEILDERRRNKSKLFYGYPNALFITEKKFGNHPGEYNRFETGTKLYLENPEDLHLKSLEFYQVIDWDVKGQNMLTGARFNYKDRNTNAKRNHGKVNFTKQATQRFELEDDELITHLKLNSGYMIDGIRVQTSHKRVTQFGNDYGGCELEIDVQSVQVDLLNPGKVLEADSEQKDDDSLVLSGKISCIGFYGMKCNILYSNSTTFNDVQLIFSGFINYN